MSKPQKSRFFYYAPLILVGIILAIYLSVLGIGKIYKSRLDEISGRNQPPEYKLKKNVEIRKVTMKKKGDSGCLEITPDAVVRKYSDCGNTLETANRLINPKNIFKLWKLLTEADLEKITGQDKGDVFELTIYTDSGTKTVYVLLEEDTPDELMEIIDTINDIIADIPLSTPSPETILPNPVSGSSPAPSSSTIIYVIQPSSSPVQNPDNTQTFTCDFIEAGSKKKPANVSNVICSSDPVPAQ